MIKQSRVFIEPAAIREIFSGFKLKYHFAATRKQIMLMCLAKRHSESG